MTSTTKISPAIPAGVEVIGDGQGFALICANGSAMGNAVMVGLLNGFAKGAVLPKSTPYRGEKTADVLAALDKQFIDGNARADWAGRAFATFGKGGRL